MPFILLLSVVEDGAVLFRSKFKQLYSAIHRKMSTKADSAIPRDGFSHALSRICAAQGPMGPDGVQLKLGAIQAYRPREPLAVRAVENPVGETYIIAEGNFGRPDTTTFYQPVPTFIEGHRNNLQILGRLKRCLDLQHYLSKGDGSVGEEEFLVAEKFTHTLQDTIDEKPNSVITVLDYRRVFIGVIKAFTFLHENHVHLGGKIQARDIGIIGEKGNWKAVLSIAVELTDAPTDYVERIEAIQNDYDALAKLIDQCNQTDPFLPTDVRSYNTRVYQLVHFNHLTGTIVAYNAANVGNLCWSKLKTHPALLSAEKMMTFIYKLRDFLKAKQKNTKFDDFVKSKLGKEAVEEYKGWFYSLTFNVQTAILKGGLTKLKDSVVIKRESEAIDERPALLGPWTQEEVTKACPEVDKELKFDTLSSILARIRERYIHFSEDDPKSQEEMGYTDDHVLGLWIGKNCDMFLQLFFLGYACTSFRLFDEPLFRINFYNADEWLFHIGTETLIKQTKEKHASDEVLELAKQLASLSVASPVKK